ncbi:hypothetical protein VCRA2116O29_950001 [Vibrio crassostreae]|nr:hypothetical protein VCRA2116O29_950001 [Vibrio crassostreae]
MSQVQVLQGEPHSRSQVERLGFFSFEQKQTLFNRHISSTQLLISLDKLSHILLVPSLQQLILSSIKNLYSNRTN